MVRQHSDTVYAKMRRERAAAAAAEAVSYHVMNLDDERICIHPLMHIIS